MITYIYSSKEYNAKNMLKEIKKEKIIRNFKKVVRPEDFSDGLVDNEEKVNALELNRCSVVKPIHVFKRTTGQNFCHVHFKGESDADNIGLFAFFGKQDEANHIREQIAWKFGHLGENLVIVIGNWSAPHQAHQESTQGKGMRRLLDKDFRVVVEVRDRLENRTMTIVILTTCQEFEDLLLQRLGERILGLEVDSINVYQIGSFGVVLLDEYKTSSVCPD